MRLFPAPYEGLHPAYPKEPPPLSCSDASKTLAPSGILGIFASGFGKLFRSRPDLGLSVAAYTAASVIALNFVTEYPTAKAAGIFLAEKGIHVPKAKMVERVGELDRDDFLWAGAFTGVCLVALRRGPWRVSSFSRYGGAACFGALGGTVVQAYLQYPACMSARDSALRQQEAAKQWDEEKRAALKRALGFGASIVAEQAAPMGIKSLQEPPKQNPGCRYGAQYGDLSPSLATHSGGNKNVQELDETLDEIDPKPHLSDQIDGERVFRPVTNYRWAPASEDMAASELNTHIEHLRQRRALLSREAELIWHRLSVREAQFHETANDSELKQERRIVLETMGEIHVNIWLQISLVDWMIADSSKNLLQVQAWKEKTQWISPPPANAERIRPSHTLKLLEGLESANLEMLEAVSGAVEILQLEASEGSGGEERMTDPRTGMPPTDPEELKTYMAGMVEKMLEEAQLKSKALQEISAEIKQQMETASN